MNPYEAPQPYAQSLKFDRVLLPAIVAGIVYAVSAIAMLYTPMPKWQQIFGIISISSLLSTGIFLFISTIIKLVRRR